MISEHRSNETNELFSAMAKAQSEITVAIKYEDQEMPLGKQFNLWTVTGEKVNVRHNGMHVLCKCKCGKEKLVKIEYLINRRAKGCRRCSQPSTKYITGKFRDLWYNIKRRCNNPSDTGYKYYGGRGIKVCDRWLNSFEDFVSDMGMYPTEAHEIDRINNDGNYEPGNCRWVTHQENAKNTRNVRVKK